MSENRKAWIPEIDGDWWQIAGNPAPAAEIPWSWPIGMRIIFITQESQMRKGPFTAVCQPILCRGEIPQWFLQEGAVELVPHPQNVLSFTIYRMIMLFIFSGPIPSKIVRNTGL